MWQTALDALDDAFFVLDYNGCVLHANRHASLLCNVEALLGRALSDLLPASIRDAVTPALEVVRLTRRLQSFDARLPGGMSWYAGHAYPNGSGVVLHLHDVTDRRRSEDALALLADAGEVLVGNLHDERLLEVAVELVVPRLGDWCVLAARPSRSGALTYRVCARDATVRERLDREISDGGIGRLLAQRSDAARSLIVPDDDRSDAFLGTRVRNLASYSLMVPLHRRGDCCGTMLIGRSPSTPPFGSHDVVVAEALGRRLSLMLENAWLFGEAKRATQLRDDVLAIVAHDLRSPLNAILLAATALPQECDACDPSLQEVTRAATVSAANEMNRLLDDLLDAARLDAGWKPQDPLPVNVAALVDHTVGPFRQRAALEHVRLDVRLGAVADVRVHGDFVRLQQALANLIDNAIRFTPMDGRVSIAAERSGGDLRLSVSDTGAGIAPDALPHLFDRFWQARRSKRGGAGLGLFIARRVVEGHGGTISVESELGRGTSFHLILPADPPANESDQPENAV
jgi:signal transduction histidine kinase